MDSGFAGVGLHTVQASTLADKTSAETRITYARPKVDEKAWDLVRQTCGDLFLPPATVAPWTFSRWIARFAANKAAPIIGALNDFVRGFTTGKDASRLHCFTKFELKMTNCDALASVFEEIKPRNIVSAPPLAKALLGPWSCAFAEYLGKVWNHTKALYFECGSTNLEVSSWVHKWADIIGWQNFYEVDYSRFDSTQSKASMKFSGQVYTKFGMPRSAQYAYSFQTKTLRGRTRRGVRWRRPPMMCSGVPNTTIGNSLMNAAIAYTALVLAGAKPGVDFALMVRGDDMLALIKPQYRACVAAFAKRLGFKPKVKQGHPICKVRFCSNAFYPTIIEGQLRYVPGPTLKCLLKIMWTITVLPVSKYSEHMRGVCLGLRNAVSHIPILREYVESRLRRTEGVRGPYLKKALREAHIKYMAAPSLLDLHPDSHAYIAEMYGLSVRMVQDLCERVGSMDKIGLYNSTSIEFLVRGVTLVDG